MDNYYQKSIHLLYLVLPLLYIMSAMVFIRPSDTEKKGKKRETAGKVNGDTFRIG